MAKAIAECTCSKCGATFQKIEFKRNRSEATSWEEWAVKFFDTCTECWKKEQEEKAMAEAAEIIEVHYGEYKNKYEDCRTVSGSYNPDTKTVKVIVSKKHKCFEEFSELVSVKIKNEYYRKTRFDSIWNLFDTIEPQEDWDAFQKQTYDLIKKYR